MKTSGNKESSELFLSKRERAVSKWKKVNNTIKFINISKESAKKTKGSKQFRDLKQKTSKWTLVRIAISMVSFLTQKTKCVSGSANLGDQKVILISYYHLLNLSIDLSGHS